MKKELIIEFRIVYRFKQRRERAQEREFRDAQKREQEAVENDGQNGLFYTLRKQKNEKLEQMQKRFAEQQEINRLAIVEKILKEENEKRKKTSITSGILQKTIHDVFVLLRTS